MAFQPKGIVPALATPLRGNETADEVGLQRLVEHVIGAGVHGVFAVGSQGESFALSFAEKKRVFEIVVDAVDGRIPVYLGSGAVTTKESIALTRLAEDVGARAASVVTPYFISPSAEELYEHYAAIARATRLPVLLYSNPGRTGVGISPALAVRLSSIDNIVGIKDSSGDLALTAEYVRHTDTGFAVLAGRDTLIYATLCVGGVGAIAATANVAPRLVVDIYEAFLAGELQRSREAQDSLIPLRLAFSMGTFPAVIKEALELMGICSGRAVAPVKRLSEAKREELCEVLRGLAIL
jgi:4-hydroxy-tetrahydrodipicolinate synthase